MMELISSLSNPKVKQVRLLRQRKARQRAGVFIVEGIHHVGEAAASAGQGRAHLESLYYAPDRLTSEFALRLVDEQMAAGVPCHALTPTVFESIAEKDNPQGLLALVSLPQPGLEVLDADMHPWLVALHAPQDPGNVGSILRTIDAVGASGLLLLDSSVDPYHPASVRASMGALFWHPIIQASFTEFSGWARRNAYQVIGTSAHAAQDYRQAAFHKPLVLLLGSERQGLSPEQQSACDLLVRMPMLGRAGSLNLSVAAGVMLYTILG